MHRCEKKWLRSVSDEDCTRRTFRREYIQSRQSYSKAVKRAKRLFQTQKCCQLKVELGSPKTFGRSINQLNISQTKKKCNLMDVLDPEGKIRWNEDVDSFCGVSLTSTVSKVLCMVLNNRLSSVAEEEDLIADEQGGFRKQRGCRDQVLMLVLLGQMEIVKKANGMMVAFIDFSKAYDKVDRRNCGVASRGWG